MGNQSDSVGSELLQKRGIPSDLQRDSNRSIVSGTAFLEALVAVEVGESWGTQIIGCSRSSR